MNFLVLLMNLSICTYGLLGLVVALVNFLLLVTTWQLVPLSSMLPETSLFFTCIAIDSVHDHDILPTCQFDCSCFFMCCA